jgi:hypothetical protein
MRRRLKAVLLTSDVHGREAPPKGGTTNLGCCTAVRRRLKAVLRTSDVARP